MYPENCVFSVYEVSLHLKQVLETQIDELYVCGEVSNYTHHSSGHMYFNIKDEHATLRCTFFKGVNYSLNFKPKDGMQVVCLGKITVFEKGGTYNLNVKSMFLTGQGNLAQQFEILKQKLFAEGLFDSARKRALPLFPARIGIITSPSGAALQDVLKVLTRRFPAEICIFPALMQGSGSPAEVISGIRFFNEKKSVDVILITRGGGSQEDLFAFNDEQLARAIAASQIPTVSAIGHEIDFTIADFVADLRAPTPSAAAELMVPDKEDIKVRLMSLNQRLHLVAKSQISRYALQLTEAKASMQEYHPQKTIEALQHRCDFAEIRLDSYLRFLQQKQEQFRWSKANYLNRATNHLLRRLDSAKSSLSQHESTLKNVIETKLSSLKHCLELQGTRLEDIAPNTVLQRGYAIIRDRSGIVMGISTVHEGDKLQILMRDGKIDVAVAKISINSDKEK